MFAEDASISLSRHANMSDMSGTIDWDKVSAPKSVNSEAPTTHKPGSLRSGQYFTPASNPLSKRPAVSDVNPRLGMKVHDNMSTSLGRELQVGRDATMTGKLFRKFKVPQDRVLDDD